MAAFDVNTDALIELTVKLGRLHRSALPVVVRGTLNDAAFEAKKWIPKTASRKFTTRNKSLFRAFSSVNKAGGFNINSMKAEVGMNSGKGSKVVAGLEVQERGGSIRGRKLIPHDKARIGGLHNKKLRRTNQFSNTKIIRGRPSAGRSRKSNLVAQAVTAAKTGHLMLIRKGSKGTYFRVNAVNFGQPGRGRKVQFRMIPIYTRRNTRNSRVQKTPFVAPASMIARKKMNKFYNDRAKIKFEKALKR